MSEQKMREDFEAWAENNALDVTRVSYGALDGEYMWGSIETAWRAWKAALASQAAQGEAVAIDRKREMAAFSNWAWLKEGEPIGRMGGQAAGIAAWMGRAQLSAQPAPAVPDDVAKDAARYRWLRNESRPDHELFMASRADCAGTYRTSNGIDAAIDAAMLAAAPDSKS